MFIYGRGRASLAMEGKSVVVIEITFMDTEDKYKKWYLKITKVHIFKSM